MSLWSYCASYFAHQLTTVAAALRNIPAGVRAELLRGARGVPGRLLEHKAGPYETCHQHTYDMGMITMCMQIIMLMAHGHMATDTFN